MDIRKVIALSLTVPFYHREHLTQNKHLVSITITFMKTPITSPFLSETSEKSRFIEY